MNDSVLQKSERGRPSSFSREQVIDQVMQLFWTHGYNDLSFNAIAKEIDLKRSSLYNTFKTKEALFTECLKYYVARSPLMDFEKYQAGQAVSPLMHRIFNDICEQRAEDALHRGCLATNTFNELATSDSTLGETMRKHHAQRQKTVADVIRYAINQGELPDNSNAQVLANIILSFLAGLNIHAKKGGSQTELKKMSQLFLNKIGFVVKN